MDQIVHESWSVREKREAGSLGQAFLFGAAVSTPFWLTLAAVLAAVAAWK